MMAFNFLGDKDNSSKSLIVDILLDNSFLTAKEIYHKAKREKNFISSYQAIFKTLQLLVTDQTLLKSGFKYTLNPKWIENMQLRISHAKNLSEPNDFLGVHLLENFYEVDKFIIKFLERVSSKESEKIDLCFIWSHFWIPFLIDRSEYNVLTKIHSNFNTCAISKSDTFLDNWCIDFWKKIGAKTKILPGIGIQSDMVILGDYVVNVHYPTEVKIMVDKFYSKVQDLKSFNVNHFFDNVLLYSKEVYVTVIEDKNLAKMYKDQYIAKFS